MSDFDEEIEALNDHDLAMRLRRIVRTPTRSFPRETRNALVTEAARRLLTYNGDSPLSVLQPSAARAATNQGEQP